MGRAPAPAPAAGRAPAPPPAAGAAPIDANRDELASGTIIAGRYRIEKRIGRGGMGAVYAVRHVNTDEALALKVLNPALADNPDTLERFRTEARAPIRIGTENVVRVTDADVAQELGGVPFMVMELLAGRDLGTELKRRGALPAGEVVVYLKQVARALDKAHAMGIIHRDLKPANLYLTQREDGAPLVKILDFGIAKLTDGASELTQDGAVFGTPWYMSPEQARGQTAKVGPAADLWALGLIAYRLLTGKNYWSAEGMAVLVGQILYEPMVPPSQTAPHLGPAFDAWFARACNREIERRFPNATELVKELARALGVSFSAQPTGQLESSQPSLGNSFQIAMQTHPSVPGIPQHTPSGAVYSVPQPGAHSAPPGSSPFPQAGGYAVAPGHAPAPAHAAAAPMQAIAPGHMAPGPMAPGHAMAPGHMAPGQAMAPAHAMPPGHAMAPGHAPVGAGALAAPPGVFAAAAGPISGPMVAVPARKGVGAPLLVGALAATMLLGAAAGAFIYVRSSAPSAPNGIAAAVPAPAPEPLPAAATAEPAPAATAEATAAATAAPPEPAAPPVAEPPPSASVAAAPPAAPPAAETARPAAAKSTGASPPTPPPAKASTTAKPAAPKVGNIKF